METAPGKIAFRDLVSGRDLFLGQTVETTFEIHGITPAPDAGTLIAVAAPPPELDPETKRLMLQRSPVPVRAILDIGKLGELQPYDSVVMTARVKIPEAAFSDEIIVLNYTIRAVGPKDAPKPKTIKVFE